jgi:perosamine synthetase
MHQILLSFLERGMAAQISSSRYRRFEVRKLMIIPHSRPSIDQHDVKAVTEVLASGRIAQGEKVKEFERALANYVGKTHGVAVSSGTSALHLALSSLGVAGGDEVIMPSYVCSSPYFATLHAGAVPKIVDIDISNYNICASTIKPQICSRTKAVIVPHLFGTPAELGPILGLGIPIVEDCAQSLGAEYKSQRVGSFGKVSVFSFYATKMITTGEGGMILTDDDECYDRLMQLRDYDKKTLAPVKYNYKMTDIQATLGLSQLGKLPEFIERRSQIASIYTNAFSEYDIKLEGTPAESKCAFYRYVMMLEDMERIRKKARSQGVICERPVFKPLHDSFASVECPNSDFVHSHALSIPLYPSLSDEEIGYIVLRLREILKSASALPTGLFQC